MYRLSYLMGGDKIADNDLLAIDVEIVGKSEFGSRKLAIPEKSLSKYIELIEGKLSKGFWNEIVSSEEILFIFCFEDGHIEKYSLSLGNESSLSKLCSRFNSDSLDKTANIYKYISDNDFYHDIMLKHYPDLVSR